MKYTIGRTLFRFKEGDENLLKLNYKYFPYALLLNRLLSEKYNGKKIKFMNIHFYSEETYRLHPQAPKYYTHFFNGHVWYSDVFDVHSFILMDDENQKSFIWKRAFDVLCEISKAKKNNELLEASIYAYNKGLEIGLNPDFRLIEKECELFGKSTKACLWINFKDNLMYSKFTLEKDGIIIYEKPIDKSVMGVEFFLDMYKKIECKENIITIKGLKDCGYLPMKISITKEMLGLK